MTRIELLRFRIGNAIEELNAGRAYAALVELSEALRADDAEQKRRAASEKGIALRLGEEAVFNGNGQLVKIRRI